jgi:hypothetical protein
MRARLLALTVAVSAVVACNDITRSIDPTIEVIEDTLTVFTLRGSPLSAPQAVDLFGVQALRLGQEAQCAVQFCPYDIVVDTAGGATVLYPVNLIESTSLPTVGVLETTSSFESITEAPTSGYQDTAAVVIDPGETVIVRGRNRCVGNFVGRDIFFAKVQLLEVGSSGGHRTARFRIRSNPNCGFRSFADGLPEF